jgi:hypothetical protein
LMIRNAWQLEGGQGWSQATNIRKWLSDYPILNMIDKTFKYYMKLVYTSNLIVAELLDG